MLVAQAGIILAICLMAFTDPSSGADSLTLMALGAVLLGFSSATQDIVIDAYRIESAATELQAMMASTYIAGYRIAMIIAGAGALYLAQYFGSSKELYSFSAWSQTYCIMASAMIVGIVTTLVISEPERSSDDSSEQATWSHARFLMLFLFAVTGFILTFYYSGDIVSSAISGEQTGSFRNSEAAGIESSGYLITIPEEETDFVKNQDNSSIVGIIIKIPPEQRDYVRKSESAGITNGLTTTQKRIMGNSPLKGILVDAIRFAAGVGVSIMIAWILISMGIVNKTAVRETYLDPVENFFKRYGMGLALLLLSLIGLYRISDIVLGVISNVFYQDMGFSKKEIAGIVKTFGLIMTIVGGFVGGILSVRYGVIRILFLGALLSSVTNLLFMAMALTGYNLNMIYIVISADNLAAGIAGAAFVAFLSSLTDIKFTAMQYAIFSSLMTLIPKITGGYSGTIVDSLGYPVFFLITTLMGIPVLFLIILAGRKFSVLEKE